MYTGIAGAQLGYAERSNGRLARLAVRPDQKVDFSPIEFEN